MAKGYIVPNTITIENLVTELRDIVDAAVDYAIKFDNGNKSAGVRARKLMISTKKKAQEIREAIQDRAKPERAGIRTGRFKPKS